MMIKAKKEHMAVFVQKERDSIIKIWDQMYVAKPEQDYSEELLTSHEKLKAQLIDDLGDKKVFLSLLNKYFTLLQEAHELEVAQKDPNRYAKGKRGDPGRLLRGEKIRKRVTKEKPKLENNLKKLIPERENKRGRPFMGNGSRFLEDLVIRLEQEVALKLQASGRTKSTIPPAQLVKRQQTDTHSRPASPVKRTWTGENTRGKPAVGGMRGSANPFGSATPRVVLKASSMASTRAGGNSVVYNTRQRSQTNNHLGRPTVALQYKCTGSSMSYYNPLTPMSMPCGPLLVLPSLASNIELEPTITTTQGKDPLSMHPVAEPPSHLVSGQSSCPGILPGWPTSMASNSSQPGPAPIQPARHPAPQPKRKYTRLVPANSLGKGMPAPPLKKGIFRPRPSALPPPLQPLQPVPGNILLADPSSSAPPEPGRASRVVSGASSSCNSDNLSSCHPPASFINLHQPLPSALSTTTTHPAPDLLAVNPA
ncbi:hypothetical protein PCASD_20217 [Puccinia coronata f. sp. avenae]|uniref:Uncharacterized protein n=1 Tax=Puccinia coronata f. sp. avenae TaxID=200324 RepID=A0A2N5TW11_9BASI|nr:hypothetical protein PCASD_20217 [Puccinia coronata f. sp. avenae]